jgi:thioredoxin-related protein
MTLLRSVVALAGLALAGIALAAGPTRPAETHFFDPSFGDLKEELQLARSDGKLGLFIMYAAEDCTPCIRMKQTILNQPRIQDEFRRHFRVLHIDFNGDTDVTDFDGRVMRSKDYAQKVARIRGTPSFTVVGLDGKELLRQYGPSRDADDFLLYVEFVTSGRYKAMPFDAYRRERLAAAR